jgi:hypothetical protein
VDLSPEVEVLYQYGLELPSTAVEAILALPREQAVGELRQVLRDAIDNGAHLHHFADRYDNDELDFGLHALWLLSELRAAEALPEVLDFLGQHADVLRDVFGETISWEPLVGFIDGDLRPLAAWMKRPGLSSIGRSALSEAVAVAAENRPELRGEAMGFLREVLEAMLTAKPKDGVIDTPLISQMMGDVIRLRARELEGLVRELFAKDLVELTYCGDLEAVLGKLSVPADPPRLVPRMLDFYRSLLQASEPSQPDFGDGFDLFANHESPKSPFTTGFGESRAAEAGRNDPCPCGSGKKFKKCCMK